jgi:predicted Zn finger-like uncharacterized protein
MRLICPNCGAQYDVSDDAIPPGGRDVQCSSCNHTWYQTEKPVTPDPVPAPPVRRPVDASISDILREEAAREQQLRDVTRSGPPKTQDDTTPKVVDADETRRRIAQMTEAEGGVRIAPAAETPADAVRVAAPRAERAQAIVPNVIVEESPNLRNMPSMNEVNASLRARSQSTDPAAAFSEEEEEEEVQRRGFRRGFVFVLLVLAILFAPYVFAEQIVGQFPQSQDAMTSYVAAVDSLRVMLSRIAGELGDAVAGFMGGETAPVDAPDQN